MNGQSLEDLYHSSSNMYCFTWNNSVCMFIKKIKHLPIINNFFSLHQQLLSRTFNNDENRVFSNFPVREGINLGRTTNKGTFQFYFFSVLFCKSDFGQIDNLTKVGSTLTCRGEAVIECSMKEVTLWHLLTTEICISAKSVVYWSGWDLRCEPQRTYHLYAQW